jgi:tetratricopeptide (TPR) repeat protein
VGRWLLPGSIPIAALLLVACASPLDRGEALYRQGDVPGALEVWRGVEPGDRKYEGVQARLEIVDTEFDRMLRRYEKRAAFFESEGRLAEAVLYYRLAYKLDPERRSLLDRVQALAREKRARADVERQTLEKALADNDLKTATAQAATLEALDPFDPAIQIEIRQVRAASGARTLHHIAEGENAYAAGNRDAARNSFQAVLELDPHNERALGYLSYIRRFEELEARQKIPPPPRSIPKEEIIAEGHYRSAAKAETSGEDFWAITEYEAALSANPRHQGARKALTALRTRLHPQVEELYEIGKRYFQDEDLHNALRAWRRALSIDPTDERMRENVGRAERMLARLEEIQTHDAGSGS